MDAVIIAIGIIVAGYLIGEGLKRQGSKQSEADYYFFIQRNELFQYINLSEDEIDQLLNDHPEVPKVIINGKTYYPLKQFRTWLTTL